MDNMSTLIKCDICHKEFELAKDMLVEEKTILRSENQADHEVTITSLVCPHCGKSYIVVVDDYKTTNIAKKMRDLYARIGKAHKDGHDNPKLEEKYRQLRWKLDYNREVLADKYKDSFYDTEDGLQKLDYTYHYNR